MSPTARSLELLRKQGYMAQVVEKYNQFAHVRQDLFGFIDILAVKGDEVLGVQATSGDHVSERCDKILAHPNIERWLAPTRKMEVWGWRKVGKPPRWALRVNTIGYDARGKLLATPQPPQAPPQ